MTPNAATDPADDVTAGERTDEGRADRPDGTTPYWYVALFSIPPGIGMAGFVASVTGEAVSALAVGTGLATTLAIAGFVLLALRSGEGVA